MARKATSPKYAAAGTTIGRIHLVENWKLGHTQQITMPETTPETTATKLESATFDNWCLLGQHRNNPFTVTLMLNDASVKMEVDTGASASLISMRMYKKIWP